MNDCSCVHPCVASVACLWCVPLVYTYAHIEHIRCSMLYNVFHMANTLTASHAAYTIDTTDYAQRSDDNQCHDYDYVVHRVYIPWYCVLVYVV